MDDNELITRLHQQIQMACNLGQVHIDDLQQSYLAHLILRFSDADRLTTEAYAVDVPLNHLHPDQLHVVADECLLRCGLQLDHQRHATNLDPHLIQIGSESYKLLGKLLDGPQAQLFTHLGQHFADLASILRTLACRSDHLMSGFDRLELWREHASSEAFSKALDAFGDHRTIAYDRRGWNSLH